MGGQGNARRLVLPRKDVKTSARSRLLRHLVAPVAEEAREPGTGGRFAAAGGIDIDEAPGEADRICSHTRAAEPSSLSSCSTFMILARAAGLGETSGRR